MLIKTLMLGNEARVTMFSYIREIKHVYQMVVHQKMELSTHHLIYDN